MTRDASNPLQVNIEQGTFSTKMNPPAETPPLIDPATDGEPPPGTKFDNSMLNTVSAPSPKPKTPATTKPLLTVIIPVLNDQAELTETLRSIRATSPVAQIEIIVVDDASTEPAVVAPEFNAQLFRNENRIGCAPSRHIGAGKASAAHLLFIDSHMRFTPKWWTNLRKHITAKPEAAWCCKSLGLSDFVDAIDERGNKIKVPNMDVSQPKGGTYTGATLNFDGPDPNKTGDQPLYRQVFEGNWLRQVLETGDEVPCLMGACYVVPTKLFFKIGGLFGLRKWGSDEPFLSMKIWLSGGEILMAADVEIGHKYRGDAPAPYRTEVWEIYFSKLRSIMVLFNEPEVRYFMARLEKIWQPYDKNPMMQEAKNTVNHCKWALLEEIPLIQKDSEQNHALFNAAKRDLRWYCKRFGIRYPLDPETVAVPMPAPAAREAVIA